MWAVAEVSWVDPAGAARVSAATIEDTSASGACLRVPDSIATGVKVNVKWHREQFQAVAKNCRRDGYEFLLGVRREANGSGVKDRESHPKQGQANLTSLSQETITNPATAEKAVPSTMETATAIPGVVRIQEKENEKEKVETAVPEPSAQFIPQRAAVGMGSMSPVVDRIAQGPRNKTSSGREKKVMEPKNRFRKFWRREPNVSSTTGVSSVKENSVENTQARPAEGVVAAKSSLLSYEDIYRAAGILRPGSGYDINKVVEMLHCDRIRNLSDDAKRASVLMAIEAVGASVDGLLRDAQGRQQALDAYETGQKKQLEDFEGRKARDNAEIEAELARVTAHYAERIKANLDQVAAEKEALRNWQMVMQHESQRISEVIDLCMKPAEPQPAAMSAAASADNGASAVPRNTGPSLVPQGATGK